MTVMVPPRPTRSRPTALLLWCALLLPVACDDATAPTVVKPVVAPAFSHCPYVPVLPWGDGDGCDSYRTRAREALFPARAAADVWVAEKTGDGATLRRLAAWTFAGAAGWIGGALLGVVLTLLVRRRRGKIGVAAHLRQRVRQQAKAIRALGAGDRVVAGLVDRLDPALRGLERRAGELARTAPILTEPGGDDAATLARQQAIWDRLDGLVARVERLHVQVGVWKEGLAKGEDAEYVKEVDQAAEEARADLEAGLKEAA